MKNFQQMIVILALLATFLGRVCVAAEQPVSLPLWPAQQAQTIYAHTNDIRQPWQGQFLSLGDERKTELLRDDQGALVFRFSNAWWSAFDITMAQPANLEIFRQGGLFIRVSAKSFVDAALEFAWLCGSGCERKVSVSQKMMALSGKGEQSLFVPASCFIRDKDNAGYVATPLRVGANGTGEVAFHSIKWVASIDDDQVQKLNCSNYKTIALEPEPLKEHWALSWWMPRHQEKLKLAQTADPELVFIGDSITEGWEKSGAAVFDRYFGQYRTLNLGFSGDRTENLLWRLRNGEIDNINPKLVVLMIGTNNTGHRQDPPALVAAGVKAVIREIQKRLPDTRILLHAIFPRGATADDHLRQLNSLINARIRNFADDRKIFFKDINRVFLTEDGVLSKEVMPDLLHPQEYGYTLWAEAIKDDVKRLIQ